MTKHKSAVSKADNVALIGPIIRKGYEDYSSGRLHGSDLVGMYILLHLATDRPRRWCGGRNRESLVESSDLKSITTSQYCSFIDVLGLKYVANCLKVHDAEVGSISIMDIFNHLKLVGLKNPDNYINISLLEWNKGKRPYCLLTHIPSPMEVLRQQARGERVVTIFLQDSELLLQHTSKLTYMDSMPEHSRDALEFSVHDLKHMENFSLPLSYCEQVGFFRCMLQINAPNSLKSYFIDSGHDLQLWYELEYVLSDMNCFAPHLLRYLYAKIHQSCLRNKESVALALHLGEEASEEEVQERVWRDLLLSMGFSRNSVITASEEPNETDNVLAERAFDAAYKLLRVTRMEMADLLPQEWEGIRDFFKLIGNRDLPSQSPSAT